MIEQEVKICDDCDNNKENSAFYIKTNLMNCYICGKDLCVKHTHWIGGRSDGIALCKTHHQAIWKPMKKLKAIFEIDETKYNKNK